MTKRFGGAFRALSFLLAIVVFGGLAVAASLKPTAVRQAPTSISIISDQTLPPEVQALEAEGLLNAFDRNALTELVLYGASEIIVELEPGVEVSEVRLKAPAPYEMSVEIGVPQGSNINWTSAAGAQNIDLSTLAAGWQTIEFNTEYTASAARLTFTPIAGAAGIGIPEVEFWGSGETAGIDTVTDALDTLANASSAGQLRRIEFGGTIGISQSAPTATETFNLGFNPADIRAAWLTYELRGIHSWLGTRRQINGSTAEGGYVAADENSWSFQSEQISPEQLVQGSNSITFGTLAGLERDYSVRSAALIIELDDGHGLVAGPGNLTDQDTGTGRLIFPNADGISAVSIPLERNSAIDALNLTFDTTPNGSVTIGGVDSSGLATTTLTGIALTQGPNVDVSGNTYSINLGGLEGAVLNVQFDNALPGSFSLVEVEAAGSPAAGARDPEALAITWPAAGEYYGRTGFLRGHMLPSANGSGAAQLFVAGLPFSTNNGSFEVAITKDQAGYINDPDETPWSVEVVALYPDGSTAAQQVVFDNESFIEGLSTYTPGLLTEVFEPNQEKTVTHEEAELTVTAGALAASTEIRVSALTDIEVPKLDTGLINVTKGPRHGYRMLPHMKFNANVKLKLPFNKNRIPQGYTDADVRVFYFDEDLGRWQALENNTVDGAAETVLAETNHFTDFIAGVVVAPESPQVASYNPTQLKDMKVADPSAKINLIAAPQGSHTGDASMSYPIELPPGRQGLAPQLQLQYSSAAGNGWTGLGWNLSMMEVSVDTRWGVPRYGRAGTDYAGKDSETYLLNGQQLTPVAHRAAPADLPAWSADKEFHTRVEGGFQRIIRRGSSPDTYWWEVTDKVGTRYAYGGDLDTGLRVDSAVLTDAAAGAPADQGNVYKWALTEVRDTNGNSITYDYTTVTDTGLAQGSVLGKQLYCSTIHYTGTNGSDGPFRVDLIRDRDQANFTRRADTIIDGRGGFKMVTADLLKRIEVHYDGDADTPAGLVRAYDFEYEEGAFYKQLLQKVTQYDAANAAFNTHTFEYFDDARESDGTYKGFEQAQAWASPDDAIELGNADDLDASAISGFSGSSSGGHKYVGLSQTYLKQKSFGLKWGDNSGTSIGELMLIDLNGDGLPDKVTKDNDQIFVRLNEFRSNGNTGFSQTEHLVANVDQFMVESTSTGSVGAEAYFGIMGGVNLAKTGSLTRVFFTDVNGDGLPDIAANGSVMYNALTPAGIPSFTADVSQTAYPIGPASVDADIGDVDLTDLITFFSDINPLGDNLRAWTAPYTGTVQISGDLALVEDTSPERADYDPADGVLAKIELNGIELYSVDIAATDYAAKVPAVAPVAVAKGDVVYFRVQSKEDGRFDQVQWAPTVAYTGVAAVETPRGLDPWTYVASDDFVPFTDKAGTYTPVYNGLLRVSGTLNKTAATSDDVSIELRKNGTLVFSNTLLGGQTGSIVLSEDIAVLREDVDDNGVTLQTADLLTLSIHSDSPIDLSSLNWSFADKPRAYYISTTEPDQPDVSDPLSTEINFAPATTLYSETNTSSPLLPWTATVTGTVTVDPGLAVSGTINAGAVVTVKSNQSLVGKRAIDIVSGVVTAPSFSIPVVAGETYFFEISSPTRDILTSVSLVSMSVELPDTSVVSVPVQFNGAERATILAQSYRSWRTFGYNGNGTRASTPVSITEADLTGADVLTQAEYDAIVASDPIDTAALVSKLPKLFPMFPDVIDPTGGTPRVRWVSGDDGLWTEALTQSSARYGADNVDVFDPASLAGATAVNKFSVSENIGGTLGSGFGLISGSISGARQSTQSIVDYMDLNGDRFPDVLKLNQAQFSPMNGGLVSSFNTVGNNEAHPRETSGDSFNIGFGGTFPLQVAAGKGHVSVTAFGKSEGNTGLQMQPLGFSSNVSEGDTLVEYDLRDMNADGLPDVVRDSGGQLSVRFNLGYEFGPEESFGSANINVGKSLSNTDGLNLSGVISGNDSIFGFGWGDTYTGGNNWSLSSITDVNGDGLADRVFRDNSTTGVVDYIVVSLNSGRGFEPAINWPVGRTDREIARSKTLSYGDGKYVTFPVFCFGLFFAPPCIVVNPGDDDGVSMTRQEFSIQDIDGDGYPEYLQSTDDAQLSVSFDTIERTNLLRQVNRPLGSTITMAYERSGNTTDQPQNKWVMVRVEVFDGFTGDGDDLLATNFTYEDGFWDREEREFYGYARVIEDHMDTSGLTEVAYRTITRDFNNDTYYEKGLLDRSTTADAAGNLFLETANTYDFVDIDTGVSVVQPDSLTATVFPQLIRTDNLFYEGQAVAGKSTFMTYAYDQYGNVIEYFDAANLDTTDDDVTSTIGYHEDLTPYIVGKADTVVVTGLGGQGAGGAYRERQATFEPGTGNMTQLRSVLETGGTAITDLTYDGFGNLTNVTGPANATGQRYALNYTFDGSVSTYVTDIIDSFGYTSAAGYDERFGELLSTTDLNGQPMEYVLDSVGRITSVTGPYEAGSGQATIEFAYNPNRIVAGHSDYATDPSVSWALTKHYDFYRNPLGDDQIETALFIDGLGRVLQTKKDAEIFNGGTTSDKMVASGRITFDFLGRQTEQFYPVEEPLGNAGTFNPTYDQANSGVGPTTTAYDILDRPTHVEIPDGSDTFMTYDFGPDRGGVTQFRTLFLDAEGNSRETYADVRKLMTSVKEINPAGGQPTIWTSYIYDPLRQITTVTDDQSNVTTAEYDNFGRMTVLDSPDMGRTAYAFDLASNLTAKQTANLSAQGTAIQYAYDFNRLSSVTYPTFTENNVAYTYGAPGASDNRANRIVTVTSEAGTEERFYGPLGEMVKQIRTINSDTQGNSPNSPEVYTTEWTFDTWNRVQQMVYPDGEVLTNAYDSGGKLQTIDGAKTGFAYPYLQLMGYDKFGQRTFLRAGNGVETTYNYVPETRRLNGLQAGTNKLFQDLSYVYDDVGNITEQANAATVNGANELGGATAFTYAYDDLYRLTGATGSWEYQPNKQETFTLDMSYDTIHNIVGKDQQHQRIQPSGTAVTQRKTSYDWTYTYGSPQPHAPSLIGDRAFSYDLNGNQTGWDHVSNGTRRTILWDEENRIQEVADNGHAKTYKYDDAGERVIKRGPQGETAYVNQFFTIRNREVGTKHVFAGGTRLVSKLMFQPKDSDGDGTPDPFPGCDNAPWGWLNNNGNGNGQGPCSNNGNGSGGNSGGGNGPEVFEKDQYYYHPDHLGSSSYVTDLDGDVFQHLEYFPFGETWVEEHSNTQRTPWLFTGKELDEETGLYYFGARYYDPRTSVWQSPDPILANYIRGERSGKGVYTPSNLNLYGYSHQRPIVAKDPNGQLVWFVVMGALAVADVAITAYDQYDMQRRYEAGEISGGQYAAGTTLNVGLSVVPGDALVRLGLRGVKSMQTATRAAAQIPWTGCIRCIKAQGEAWESALSSGKYSDALDLNEVVTNHKTFDFFKEIAGTGGRGVAISAKTMNTTTQAMAKRPSQAYSRVKRYIDEAAGYSPSPRQAGSLQTDAIQERAIELAIPSGTPDSVMRHIDRAGEYGRMQGVDLIITITE